MGEVEYSGVLIRWEDWRPMQADLANVGRWTFRVGDQHRYVNAYQYHDEVRQLRTGDDKHTALDEAKRLIDNPDYIPRERYIKPSEIMVSAEEWEQTKPIMKLWLVHNGAQILVDTDIDVLTQEAKRAAQTLDAEGIAERFVI